MADTGSSTRWCGVGRIYPPNKQVLRDISLSFFYGAKIGVLGLNGSGKSTLLRIMAGVDQDYIGETMLSKGITVGLLEQEPQLDRDKTVRQVVEEAVQPIVDLLARFDEVNNRFAEEMTPEEMDGCSRSRASCRRSSTGVTPGTWTAGWSWPWTPCAARRATRRSRCSPAASGAGWPCAGCC